MSKVLLVTGATGHQGGAVINALLKSSAIPSVFTILALTRDVASKSSLSLAAKSPFIKLLQGNLNDAPSIFSRASTPIWGVFSIQNPMSFGSSTEIEEQQGKALVDAAIAHGVKRFVYTSVDRHGSRSDTDPTYIRHFASKHRIELYLKSRSETAGTMTWTILRPTGFMENFYPGLMGKLFATVWSYAIPPGIPLQLISVDDIGVFGAQAFLKSDSKDYQNKAISLAGDELTFVEASKVCKEKTGHVLPSTFGFVAWMVLMMLPDIKMMFRWFGEVRLDADIAECKRLHPEVMSFGEWIGRHTSWGK
jgi:uncharacterized protein YbjT (DUF2867 family)